MTEIGFNQHKFVTAEVTGIVEIDDTIPIEVTDSTTHSLLTDIDSNTVDVATETTLDVFRTENSNNVQNVEDAVLVLEANLASTQDLINDSIQEVKTNTDDVATETTLAQIQTNTQNNVSSWWGIPLGDYSDKVGFSWELFASDVTNVERNLIGTSDVLGNSIALPSTGTASQIASSGIGDTTQSVILHYFTAGTDETITSDVIALNGNTPVNIPSNVFRVVAIQLLPTSALLTGTVYVGPTSAVWLLGVPSIIYMFKQTYNPIVFSPYQYVPANRTVIFDNLIFTSDISAVGQVMRVKVYSYYLSNLSIGYQRTWWFNQGMQQLQRSFTSPPSGATLRFTIYRESGSGSRQADVLVNGFYEDTS